jgi:hypothetical protein
MQQSVRCYTCGTLNPYGQYYCMRCGQSLVQWTMPQQAADTRNNQAKYQYFLCSRCGTQNVVGTTSCGNCNEHFYYTCPHCNTWVNNTFVTCPNCFKPLNWPAQDLTWNIYAGNTTYIPGKLKSERVGESNNRGALSAILTVLLVAGLLIVGLGILTNNSNSSSASNQAAVSAVSKTNTPQTHNTSSPTQTPASAITLSPAPNTTPTPTPTPAVTVTSVATNNTQGTVYEYSLPASIVNAASNTSTSSIYTPASDSYLQQLVPGWGKCSGGSCRGSGGN